jgi:hypothetical protein
VPHGARGHGGASQREAGTSCSSRGRTWFCAHGFCRHGLFAHTTKEKQRFYMRRPCVSSFGRHTVSENAQETWGEEEKTKGGGRGEKRCFLCLFLNRSFARETRASQIEGKRRGKEEGQSRGGKERDKRLKRKRKREDSWKCFFFEKGGRDLAALPARGSGRGRQSPSSLPFSPLVFSCSRLFFCSAQEEVYIFLSAFPPRLVRSRLSSLFSFLLGGGLWAVGVPTHNPPRF